MTAGMVEFTVYGSPLAKGRPRFSARNGVVRAHTPKATEDAEKRIAEAARAAIAEPLDGALRMEVWTFHPIPKSYSAKAKEAALFGADIELRR